MKRTAAVGELIVDAWRGSGRPSADDVVAALLLHDLGNIVKFNFSGGDLWEGFSREEILGWRSVRDDVAAAYSSSDDHVVTNAMVRDIGAPAKVGFLVENMLLEKMPQILSSGDVALKVLAYSDQRVSPGGVVRIGERFMDLRRRYRGRQPGRFGAEDERMALELEAQIMRMTDLTPGQLDDAAVLPYIGRYGTVRFSR